MGSPHWLRTAIKIGNNIAIMGSGRLIQHGKPEEITLKPNSQYVKDFVAHTNLLLLYQWQEGDSLETLEQDRVVVATPDISMREALELRYRTGLPVLLGTKKRLEGVLSDNDFYHALQGKHFSAKLT